MKNVLENRLISLQNLQEFKNLLIQKLQNGDIPLPGGAPATTTTPGIVKPDGTSITVDSDGTIHSQGGSGGTNADWDALPGEPGYIYNKPFDSGDYKILGTDIVIEDDPETSEQVYSAQIEEVWFTTDDFGKEVKVKFEGNEYIGTVQNIDGSPYVLINFSDPPSLAPIDYPAFLIASGDETTMIQVMVEEVTTPTKIIEEIGMGEASKLDGSKIKVDNTTIQVNENGEIYSVAEPGAGNWNELEGKPFESIGSGLTVSSNQLKESYATSSTIGGVRITWNSSTNSLYIYTQD